jgi:hypothetical protein
MMTVKFQKSVKGQHLFDRVREIFECNNDCPRSMRWEDPRILEVIEEEFGPLSSERNYVSVWRNLFNSGQMHKSIEDNRTFVAYRVNVLKQFTKAVSPKKGLTFKQLYDDYNKHGFKIPRELAKEVEGYRNE